MSYLLKPIGFFNTPESTEDLQNYIDLLTGNEKFVANVIMGKTWNLCAELTKQPESPEPKISMNTAQMAMYLDRGIEAEFRNDKTDDDGEFNEWLCDSGDLERTWAVMELCEELAKVMPEELEFPWSTLCYIVLEERLAEFIFQRYKSKADKDTKKIINHFEQLLVEFTDLENARG